MEHVILQMVSNCCSRVVLFPHESCKFLIEACIAYKIPYRRVVSPTRSSQAMSPRKRYKPRRTPPAQRRETKAEPTFVPSVMVRAST